MRDYHYIVQTSNGEWAHKMNTSPSTALLSYTDEDYYWTNVIGACGSSSFYNTAYLAVDPYER